MSKDLTFPHALTHIKKQELKDMLVTYDPETRINPNVGKQELVKDLIEAVPESEKEKIIYSVFNQPNSRYTAHLATVESMQITEEELKEKIQSFNEKSVFGNENYQKSVKEGLELKAFTDSEILIIFSSITRQPQYDVEAMTSNVVTYQKRIRVIIKRDSKRVIVYTGDRDLFNTVLTSLTVTTGIVFKPLESNKTGISETDKGSFTFDTVKFIDFVYNGLSTIGSITEVNQIELESLKSSKKSQKVKVQGDMLLKDKVISEYLLQYSRNLVGMKTVLGIEINDVRNLVSAEIGIRDSRIKIGIKKENYSLEQLKTFFVLIENALYQYIDKPGLIDLANTKTKLSEIRDTALRDN